MNSRGYSAEEAIYYRMRPLYNIFIKRARDDPPQQRENTVASPLHMLNCCTNTTKDLREGFLRMFNLLIGLVAVVAIALVIIAIIGVVAHLSKILAFIVGLVVIPATVLYAVLYFISWVF